MSAMKVAYAHISRTDNGGRERVVRAFAGVFWRLRARVWFGETFSEGRLGAQALNRLIAAYCDLLRFMQPCVP